MENIAPVAGTLSTYGLYAVCAILLIAVVYLFKQQRELEKELRDNIGKYAEENAKYAAENAKLLIQNTEAMNKCAELISGLQSAVSELKYAIQVMTERDK